MDLATVTNVTDVFVNLTNEDDFEASVDGGVVKLTAKATATDGASTTVKIEAVGDLTVEKSITVKTVSKDSFAQTIADGIEIENGTSVVKDGEEYTVIGGFSVPVSEGVATISWTSEDTTVEVDAEGNLTLDVAEERSITLTATVEYKGKEVSKEFKLNIPSMKVYYDEDFEGFTVGTLVSLAQASNTNYPGFEFTSSTRGDGGEADHYVNVESGGPNGNYVRFVVKRFADSRSHYFDLTNMNGVEFVNQMYLSFDFKLADDASTVLVTGGSTNLQINKELSDAIVAGNWYNVAIVSYADEATTLLTIKDADGNVVDTQKLSSAFPKPTRIGSVGSVTEDFSIDNLKIMDAVVPLVTTEDVTRIAPGETLTVANIKNSKNTSVSLSDTTNFSYVIDGEGNLNITAANDAGNAATVDITITAESDLTQTATCKLTVGDNKFVAEDISEKIDILKDNATLTASGTEFKASGDFTLPTKIEDATITWTASPSNLISISDGKATVIPASAEKVTVTATVDYKGATATKVFVVDLTEYNALVQNIVALEKANTSIKYAADEKGAIYSLTLADGAVVEGNITLPSSAAVTINGKKYAVDVAWSSSDNTVLSNDGVISVSDKNKHAVALTKTIEYKQNNVVLATDSVTYNVNVQFDPDTLTKTITDLVNAKNATIKEEASKLNLDTYLRGFVYNNQVKFDAALASNFTGIPTYVSAAGTFNLPLTGAFGSKFVWESNDLNVFNVTPSTGEVAVSLPTYAKTVALTAKIQAGTADTGTYSTNVSVAGLKAAGGGGGGGGGYTGGNGGGTRPNTSDSIANGDLTPVAPTNPSNNVFNPNPSGFTDLDSVPWAVTAINNLYVNNIIEGKTETEFYPNDNITRAEFATILVKAFKIPVTNVTKATFYDVSLGHWASKYVETAAAMGIVEGYDDGSFEPNTNVTRQDMAIMVKRAADATGYSFTEKVEAVSFTDEAMIAAYAKAAVAELQKAGIVKGVEGGAYAPLATSTRAQACQIIYNVFNK